MRIVKVLFSGLLFAGLLVGISQQVEAQHTQQITLAGYKVTPRVATSGSGFITIKLKSDTLTVHGEFEDLMTPYSGAYIMAFLGDRGGSNQLYRLKAELNDQRTGGTFKAKNNTFVLSEGQLALLKKGDLYIVVATIEHQSGEIRGDIASLQK